MRRKCIEHPRLSVMHLRNVQALGAIRTFPKVQQEPYEHREAAPQSGPSLRSQLELIKLMVGKETGKARLKGSGRGKK